MKRYQLVALSIPVVAALAFGQDAKKDPKKDPDQIGSRSVDKGVNFYSIQREIALGQMLATQVKRQSKVVEAPRVTEYINRIAQNLARNSDAKMPLNVAVLDSPSPNAFALPGGYLFVNTGLILTAANEAELAGAMAHEIGHVAARHSTRQATRAEIASMATVPLIFMGGWGGVGARQAAGVVVPAQMMQFSRSFEAEADLLGLEYMYQAGYDPTGLVDMFEKLEALEKRKSGTIARVFATHPMTEDRVRSAQENIQENLKTKPAFVLNTSEFDDIKDQVLTMHNTRKLDDPNKPQLRKAPGADSTTDDDPKPTKRRLAAAD